MAAAIDGEVAGAADVGALLAVTGDEASTRAADPGQIVDAEGGSGAMSMLATARGGEGTYGTWNDAGKNDGGSTWRQSSQTNG